MLARIGAAIVALSAGPAGGCRSSPAAAVVPSPVTPDVSDDQASDRSRVDPAARQRAQALVADIGVLGASASAGFGSSVAFVDALDRTLKLPHRSYDVSSSAHYLRPLDIGRVQVEALKARGVSMVVAVDFLFWFAYGVKDDNARRRELAVGMAMLEEFSVPVFVGDLPNVRGASRRMISRSQIPSPEMLAELNTAIAAWAEEQPGIERLPMADWMTRLKLEEPVQLYGEPYSVQTGRVLQWDLLHPSTAGQAVLAALVLQQVADRFGGFIPQDTAREPDAVAQALRPAPSATDGLPLPPD